MAKRKRLPRTVHDRSAYGARLQAARVALGLTQADVAARLGVSREYVAGLESGRRLESWPSWLGMMATLGYSLDLVAPELVDSHTACRVNQVSEQLVKPASKKTDPTAT